MAPDGHSQPPEAVHVVELQPDTCGLGPRIELRPENC